MSAVAVQSLPLGFRQTYQQNRHSAVPPAALVTPAKKSTPGILSLNKPLNPQRQSPRQRKASPSGPGQSATPKSEKSRKPRSRPTSDESEHETPSKPRGRRQNAEKSSPTASPASPATKRRNPCQTPSPESDPTPQLQKPSGRLARQRKGTKSTPALCAALSTPASASAPVPVPQLSSSVPHPSGLSRSAPMPTSMPQSLPARMRRTLTNNGREEQKEVPPSPSPRRVREPSKGPLTAPLNGAFPARPPHARSPSEALFNMSLEDFDDEHEPQEMPVLFRNRSGDKVYAGGRFQNGPDTTTLPAPSFLSGF